MFKSLDLSLIVEFILMFYKDKPIDWLLDHIMWVKVCNPEKDAVSKVSELQVRGHKHGFPWKLRVRADEKRCSPQTSSAVFMPPSGWKRRKVCVAASRICLHAPNITTELLQHCSLTD